MKDKILEDFKSQKNTLDAFNERMINLLEDLLRENNLIIHQITGRTKDFDSLSKKIDRKQGKYVDLSDITDLVGIRIITYLESDVDLVADLIRKEFTEDKVNSTDKRKLNSDQFGYKSLHIVCSLNENRTGLTEYSSYKGIKCEIQIRSILQHAWAEIEHDLGYKSKSEIPNEYKRDFNRLAALLETADKEFDRLKQKLDNYEKEVESLIQKSPESVELNQASLHSLISSNTTLQKAGEIIRSNTGAEFFENRDFSGITPRFKMFNIKSIKELEDSIQENEKLFLAFVDEFTRPLKYDKLGSSLPLFYFQHFLAGMSESEKVVQSYLDYEEPFIASDEWTPKKFIDMFLKVKTK